jgi:hypothetical protein
MSRISGWNSRLRREAARDLRVFMTIVSGVDHYDSFFALHLTNQQKRDLAEYLKSL